MNKPELIAEISDKTGMKKTDVASVLEAASFIAAQQLKSVGEFTLPGIAIIKTKARAARMGRNPTTGASVQIAARTAVTFKPVKALVTAVA